MLAFSIMAAPAAMLATRQFCQTWICGSAGAEFITVIALPTFNPTSCMYIHTLINDKRMMPPVAIRGWLLTKPFASHATHLQGTRRWASPNPEPS